MNDVGWTGTEFSESAIPPRARQTIARSGMLSRLIFDGIYSCVSSMETEFRLLGAGSVNSAAEFRVGSSSPILICDIGRSVLKRIECK